MGGRTAVQGQGALVGVSPTIGADRKGQRSCGHGKTCRSTAQLFHAEPRIETTSPRYAAKAGIGCIAFRARPRECSPAVPRRHYEDSAPGGKSPAKALSARTMSGSRAERSPKNAAVARQMARAWSPRQARHLGADRASRVEQIRELAGALQNWRSCRRSRRDRTHAEERGSNCGRVQCSVIRGGTLSRPHLISKDVR